MCILVTKTKLAIKKPRYWINKMYPINRKKPKITLLRSNEFSKIFTFSGNKKPLVKIIKPKREVEMIQKLTNKPP